MMKVEKKERSNYTLYYDVSCYCPHCGVKATVKTEDGIGYEIIGSCTCGAVVMGHMDGTYITLTFAKDEDGEDFNIAAKAKR